MLRPFPYQFRVGTDIQSVSRISQAIEGTSGAVPKISLFQNKLLNYRELAVFRKRYPESPEEWSDLQRMNVARHLAGRWAAKEAVIKAVRHRYLNFLDIEIRARVVNDSKNRQELSAVIFDRSCVNFRWWKEFLEPTTAKIELITKSSTDSTPSEAPSDVPNDLTAARDYWTAIGYSDQVDGQIAQISISHDGDFATAVCIAAEEPQPGDVGGELAARMM